MCDDVRAVFLPQTRKGDYRTFSVWSENESEGKQLGCWGEKEVSPAANWGELTAGVKEGRANPQFKI